MTISGLSGYYGCWAMPSDSMQRRHGGEYIGGETAGLFGFRPTSYTFHNGNNYARRSVTQVFGMHSIYPSKIQKD